MSGVYSIRERSWEDGAPVEYYVFMRDTETWRYNTSDRVLSRNEAGVLHDYLPLSISREGIQQGAERNKLTLNVHVPRSADVVRLWHPIPTSAPVALTIYGGHVGDGDEVVTWIGRVVAPKFRPEVVTLLGEPTTTLARKSGQVQSWQRGCMHVLYKQGDGLCNANREDFAVEGVIEASSGVTVQSASFADIPDGRLAGGYIEWTTPSGTVERRSINTHDGNIITVIYGSAELPVGTEFAAYPGCRHNWDDCQGFFNNGVNYGGDLYSPERSPFNGNPVF